MGLTKVRGKGLGTLGDGTASDNSIVFDGNAQDFHIGLDDSADDLVIGKGSVLGTTTHMSFNENGQVLKPLQPFFVAKPTASGDGQTRDPYKFENVIHNVGNHFVTSGTGAHERFVAPVTARYMFTAMPGYLQGGNNFATRFLINGSIFAEPVRFIQGSAASHCAFTLSIVVQLEANDYVTLSSSGFTYHINTSYTFFSGILLS